MAQLGKHAHVQTILEWFKRELDGTSNAFNLSHLKLKGIIISPLVITLLYGFLLVIESTRDFALSLRNENQPIELLTFVFLFVGAVLGIRLANFSRQKNDNPSSYRFFAVFSMGLLFTAMEEVAWGQWFFGFRTPAVIDSINIQGELTIHNIKGLHGKAEFARVAFGTGGLVGIWLARKKTFENIGVPMVLLPWFIVIAVQAYLDLAAEFFALESHLETLVGFFSEFIEMLIGMAGFLYVWLHWRKQSLAPSMNCQR